MAIEKFSDNGGILITGEHIEWYRFLTMLMALRLELCGIQMHRGIKASVLMKKELNLPKSHHNRMTFMYANNCMYACKVISKQMWSENIKYLKTRFND